MRKTCIVTERPSRSIPPSTGGRWNAWRNQLSRFFAKWLRFSVGTSISLAFAVLAYSQEAPKERIRFLDGKARVPWFVKRQARTPWRVTLWRRARRGRETLYERFKKPLRAWWRGLP